MWIIPCMNAFFKSSSCFLFFMQQSCKKIKANLLRFAIFVCFLFLLCICFVNCFGKVEIAEQVLFCFSINLVNLSDNALIWTTKKGLKVPLAYIIYDLSDPRIRDKTHALQGKQGVYGFINVKSDHLYIGSSTNLRKRLLEHLFTNKTFDAKRLCLLTSHSKAGHLFFYGFTTQKKKKLLKLFYKGV